MANATGRPIAPLILSSDERAYLERQVRRQWHVKLARSQPERVVFGKSNTKPGQCWIEISEAQGPSQARILAGLLDSTM
jgi:hypothetical protein